MTDPEANNVVLRPTLVAGTTDDGYGLDLDDVEAILAERADEVNPHQLRTEKVTGMDKDSIGSVVPLGTSISAEPRFGTPLHPATASLSLGSRPGAR